MLLRDRLPAYISWEQYLANLERLKQNRALHDARGAPKRGAALLQGLVVCSKCFASDQGPRSGIPSAWNVFSWPTTYVIDHTGVIRHINLRGTSLDQPLEELVAQAEEAKKADGR